MASDTVVGNGTKRLQNGSIHAVFPLFCPRYPSSLITGRFFLENDSRWLAEKRHVIRNDGLRRVIITGFTVSWSVSIVSDAVFLDLGMKHFPRETRRGNRFGTVSGISRIT